MLNCSAKILEIMVIAFIVAFVAGCSGNNDIPTNAERLQTSVDTNWMQYKQTHALPEGGVAVYVESPSGSYFASSGMPAGVNQNTRFRAGSNTKTFTAAAIMLLNQLGSLNIDDFITSNIPVKGIPYVPLPLHTISPTRRASRSATSLPYRRSFRHFEPGSPLDLHLPVCWAELHLQCLCD